LVWGRRPSICDIVINTTSIGLTKDEKINIDFGDCSGDKNKLFYDLIYNPKETNFLREARLRGNKTMNGQKMFLNQAIYAFNLWTNITPEIDDEVIELLDR
jgi:shikimate dehydrogenase